MQQSTSLIDASGLDGWQLSSLLDEVERYRRVNAEHQALSDRISAGVTHVELAQEQYPGVPIVAELTYNEPAEYYRLIPGFHALPMDKRPVFMRGAKECLVMRHCRTQGGNSPNGWAELVFFRALRMSRQNFFDVEPAKEWASKTASRLSDKYHLTSPFYKATVDSFYWRFNAGEWVLNGRFVSLSESERENIKALRRIIDKTDKLEKRMELARQHMRERMVA